MGIWKFVVQLKKVGSNAFIQNLAKDWVIKLGFQELIAFGGCYHNLDYCQICALASIVHFKKLFILSFDSITLCMNIQIFSNSPSPSSISNCFPHAFSLPLMTKVAQTKVRTPTYGIYVEAQLCWNQKGAQGYDYCGLTFFKTPLGFWFYVKNFHLYINDFLQKMFNV